jgi:hypothetical protein
VYIRDYFLLPLSSVVLNSSLLPDSLVFPILQSVHMVYSRDIYIYISVRIYSLFFYNRDYTKRKGLR